VVFESGGVCEDDREGYQGQGVLQVNLLSQELLFIF
jgi:hypothetical protein